MFGQDTQFYPTPDKIRRKMTAKIKQSLGRGKCVLDPSAGKGDLLKSYRFNSCKRYAIELDPDLRTTLQGAKGINVIGVDFLQFQEMTTFDVVIMNPPFKNGASHIVKAWEVLKPGGELIALCNSTTVDNPKGDDGVNLSLLIQNNGGEIEDLGQCFSVDVERTTKVNVSMIYLVKPEKKKEFDFSSHNFDFSDVDTEGFKASPLEHTGEIKRLVAKYNAAHIVIVRRFELQEELNFYLTNVSSAIATGLIDKEDKNCLSQQTDLDEQLLVLKSRFWNTLLDKLDIGKRLTSSYREEFKEFQNNQSLLEFSENNILEMLQMFYGNKEFIMKKCIREVFEKGTRYYAENSVHREGWVTNKGWKFNERIIIPRGISYDNVFKFSRVYGKTDDFYSDLDRVVCYLDGVDYAKLDSDRETISWAIANWSSSEGRTDEYRDWFESKYFKIKAHKKGTVWLEFKDPYLLDDLNYIASDMEMKLGGDRF